MNFKFWESERMERRIEKCLDSKITWYAMAILAAIAFIIIVVLNFSSAGGGTSETPFKNGSFNGTAFEEMNKPATFDYSSRGAANATTDVPPARNKTIEELWEEHFSKVMSFTTTSPPQERAFRVSEFHSDPTHFLIPSRVVLHVCEKGAARCNWPSEWGTASTEWVQIPFKKEHHVTGKTEFVFLPFPNSTKCACVPIF